MFLPHPRGKVSIVGMTVSSQSSHHPQEVLLAQFSLYVHKGGLKPKSFHFSEQRLTTFGLLNVLIEPGSIRPHPDGLGDEWSVLIEYARERVVVLLHDI